MNPFLISAITIFAYMVLVFILAQILRNNSIVDIAWGGGFIFAAHATYFNADEHTFAAKLVTTLVIFWGVRLGAYLLLRNWGKPEDWRYANWRKEWGKYATIRAFFQVFMLQGVMMFIISLPVTVANSYHVINERFSGLHLLGCILFAIGFYFEAVGDAQMFLFKSDKRHAGKVMNRGLWRFTRHPNYFGEVLMWWGIFFIAAPSSLWYISIWAPLTITFLLLKVSGVTMLEKKYEGHDAYSVYKQHTNAFFPWFPKRSIEHAE